MANEAPPKFGFDPPKPDWKGPEFTGKFQSLLEFPTPKRILGLGEQCVPPQKGWDFDYYSEESSDGDMIEDGM